jgi:phosphopantothenoylcysteine decarboxylase/phosphopantothenate--cysteine ligase
VLNKPLAGKKVLITSGPCREKVDDVRVLTTRSSGLMGRELALEAFRLGADVTVVHREAFPCVANLPADSAQDMHDGVMRQLAENGADIYISAAAISDYAPVPFNGKIPSGKKRSIDLVPLPKLLDNVLLADIPFTVAFKLGYETKRAVKTLLKKGVAMVVTNRPDAMGADRGTFIIMTPQGSSTVSGSKEEAAAAIWAVLLEIVSPLDVS